MSTVPALELNPTMAMRATPAMVAFAEMLALGAADVESLVERELADNPALERVPRAPDGLGDASGAGTTRRTGDAPHAADAVARLPAGRSPADRLLADARAVLPPSDGAVAELVLGNLDDRGYADLAPEDLAARLGIACARVRRVLAVLRDVGPPALGARDLRECLLLQLDRLDGEDRMVVLARAVVCDHLQALARRAVGKIATATGTTPADIAAVAEFLRTRLDPYPARGLRGPDPAPPVVCDVVVREDPAAPGGLAVDVPDRDGLALCGLIEGCAGGHVALRRDLARARALLGRLGERRAMLRRVAKAAVAHQGAFMRQGAPFLRPLTRAQLAGALGVHESTVSRTVARKHVLMPDGRIVALAAFFDAAAPARDALARLVATEPHPRSDGELARLLARQGIPVARRTVAKYRTQLGILPQHLR